MDATLRGKINQGEVLFIDQHLSEAAELLHNGTIKMDLAVLEVAGIEKDGGLIPTTSVGNSASFAALADKVILEINESVPLDVLGIHDIYVAENYPYRNVIPRVAVDNKIGRRTIPFDINKVVGIVFTSRHDSPADIAAPDAKTSAIASHILNFFGTRSGRRALN